MPVFRGAAKQWNLLFNFKSLAEYHKSDAYMETQKKFSKNRPPRGKRALVSEFVCQFGRQCKYTRCLKLRKLVEKKDGTVSLMETNDKHNHIEIGERKQKRRNQMSQDLEDSGIADLEIIGTARTTSVTGKKQKRKEKMSKNFLNCKSLDFCKPYYSICHCSTFPNIIKYFNQQ